MPDTTPTPGLPAVLARRWPTVVLAVLLASAAAFGISKLQPKRYSATASLVFGERGPAADLLSSRSSSDSSNDAQRRAATTVELVAGRDVVNRTAAIVHRSPDAVAEDVKVSGKGLSNVVTVQASDRSPHRAARLANTYARQYILLRREAGQTQLNAAERVLKARLDALSPEERDADSGRLLRQRLAELAIADPNGPEPVQIAEQAYAPKHPTSPNVQLNVGLGALLGLIVGLGLATLRERSDRRLVGPQQQSEAYRLPILGELPRMGPLERAPEALRALQARLRHLHLEEEIRSVLVTSARSGEGVSTVAWHMAAGAAESPDRRVLLIEADMRTPSVALRTGLNPSPGLADVLEGRVSVEDAIQYGVNSDNGHRRQLDVLVASPPAPDADDFMAYAAMESDRMRELLRWAVERYELVVIDAPSPNQVADAIPLAAQADGVLVVSRTGAVTRHEAESLREVLRGVGASVLGLVVNPSAWAWKRPSVRRSSRVA
jgi:polysaccharide biosynthesis transport protein